MFHLLDIDDTGKVTAYNLQIALKRHGILLQLGEIMNMIKEVSPNGTLNVEVFNLLL